MSVKFLSQSQSQSSLILCQPHPELEGKKHTGGHKTKKIAFFLLNAGMWLNSISAPVTIRHSCGIRRALCRGQIAILLRDEVSPKLIKFPQSLVHAKRSGDIFSLSAIHLRTRSAERPLMLVPHATCSINQSTY